MKSKVIQISTSLSESGSLVIASCKDGSMWVAESGSGFKLLQKPFEEKTKNTGTEEELKRNITKCIAEYPDEFIGDNIGIVYESQYKKLI